MNKKFFGHLKTVLTHKMWVFYYCCKFGIPIRGVLHDMSKFSPTEFFESVKYYSGTRSPIDVCKEENGYSKAWLHHRGRNPHHYEYWTDNYDSGTISNPMPFECALEMLCDYLGAGRAYNKSLFTIEKETDWWLNKRKHANAMHQNTKSFIDTALYLLINKCHIDKETLRCAYHLIDMGINPVTTCLILQKYGPVRPRFELSEFKGFYTTGLSHHVSCIYEFGNFYYVDEDHNTWMNEFVFESDKIINENFILSRMRHAVERDQLEGDK